MFFCRVLCCHRKALTPDVCRCDGFTVPVISPLSAVPGIGSASHALNLDFHFLLVRHLETLLINFQENSLIV